MYKRKGFLVDTGLCIGCRSCEMACRNENHTPPAIHWRHVRKIAPGRYLSMACNHCENPECFRVCPKRAFTRRRDGVVEINSMLCDGCRRCVRACPYLAPQYNPRTNKVSRCNMCHPRQDKGKPPACVEACPTGALSVIDLYRPSGAEMFETTEGFCKVRLTRPSIRFCSTRETKMFLLGSPVDGERAGG